MLHANIPPSDNDSFNSCVSNFLLTITFLSTLYSVIFKVYIQ